MAKLSRWAIFLRAFLITLVVGQTGRVDAQGAGEADAWQVASSLDSAAAYYRYLSQYPTGAYVEQAIAALTRLGAMNRAGQGRQIPSLRSPSQDDGGGSGAGGTAAPSGRASRVDSQPDPGPGPGPDPY